MYQAFIDILRSPDEERIALFSSVAAGLETREFVSLGGCTCTTNRRLIMDHTGHVRLTQAELTPAVLEGATIYGADDHKVGKVDHVHGTGSVIIDVGGFLGMGAKPVSVPLGDLSFMRDGKGEVHAVTTWTKDQLKAMPEHHD